MADSEICAMIEAQRELNESFVAEYQRLMEIGDPLRKFNNANETNVTTEQ
ncbi:MAG: hypothetical protein OXP71_04705 [Candidatus Poribacteria bacterium]|nr:hypothetical protein [Candidatus Poribacteria bacterium]